MIVFCRIPIIGTHGVIKKPGGVDIEKGEGQPEELAGFKEVPGFAVGNVGKSLRKAKKQLPIIRAGGGKQFDGLLTVFFGNNLQTFYCKNQGIVKIVLIGVNLAEPGYFMAYTIGPQTQEHFVVGIGVTSTGGPAAFVDLQFFLQGSPNLADDTLGIVGLEVVEIEIQLFLFGKGDAFLCVLFPNLLPQGNAGGPGVVDGLFGKGSKRRLEPKGGVDGDLQGFGKVFHSGRDSISHVGSVGMNVSPCKGLGIFHVHGKTGSFLSKCCLP